MRGHADSTFDLATAAALSAGHPALAAILATVLDRASAGVIVYGGKGERLHVNLAAQGIAARGDGLRFDRNGLLHACDPAAERALAYALLARTDERIVRAPRREGQEAYSVVVTPLPRELLADPRGGCLVLIHDPDRQFPAMAREIARLFGMPLAPARVVEALVRGEDLKTYASQHGLSYNTVRYHLKTAFTRTGVHTQSRLVQRVTRALTELGVGG